MKQGFTLIELLVVVLIIGILAAVAVPQYQTAVERSRATEGLELLSAMTDSIQRYHSQHDEWPHENIMADFSKLDITIPKNETLCSREGLHKQYGGKYFCVGNFIAGNSVWLWRQGVSTNKQYTLIGTVVANDDDTYTVTRRCSASKSEGQEYCNAITGGHNDDF